MSHLTKKQHYVPAFYIRLWSIPNKEQVICHDLFKMTSFPVSPNNILSKRFFYEENRDEPDNEVENILAQMESDCTQCFRDLNAQKLKNIDHADGAAKDLVRSVLNEDNCRKIKTFAAFQYLRGPGAIDQKQFELQNAKLSQEQKDFLSNPGHFVMSGYEYLKDRFLSLKLLVLLSEGQDFITSDWPCFDLKEDSTTPILGEEIGRNPAVIVYLPLTPRLGAILYSSEFSANGNSRVVPPVILRGASDAKVRNQNTLVIQKADQYLIANSPKDFIFQVAKKRKKVTDRHV